MLILAANADSTAELRGWLTLLWAFVIGSGTLIGAWIGVRNYLHSTWQAKVATARLVWADGRGPHFAPIAGSRRYPREDAKGADLYPETSGCISAPDLFEARHVGGSLTTVWKVDGSLSYVQVTNNSKEPVSNVELTLRQGSKIVAGRQGAYDMPRILPPDRSRVIQVMIPREGNHPFRPGRFALRFTDSAGNRWERMDSRPPTLLPKYKPPRFQNMRAWRFRTVQRYKKWRAERFS